MRTTAKADYARRDEIVLEHVTLADLVRGELPPHVDELIRDADAWSRR